MSRETCSEYVRAAELKEAAGEKLRIYFGVSCVAEMSVYKEKKKKKKGEIEFKRFRLVGSRSTSN